ncbi:MtN3 and saliva related transmembrane protein [Actinocorallia herbida]|uniref:MtN3 and saliva related transmembrane protein n=1 Tax=Actinocorallia herbida TaxID=58109 RepID=A0A3N1CQ51_9ACTN|nr:SemiSWEET transporter [Actinocorallia herbida]ROO83294.1 MtN3 and saliva related transmembrane protein [Actinocorallia herbida]
MTSLGLLAGALTTGCWLPQLLRSWRTRSTDDISWTYLALLGTGIVLWLAYGLLSGDLALIAANGVTLLFITTIAGMKSRETARPRVADPSADTLAGP